MSAQRVHTVEEAQEWFLSHADGSVLVVKNGIEMECNNFPAAKALLEIPDANETQICEVQSKLNEAGVIALHLERFFKSHPDKEMSKAIDRIADAVADAEEIAEARFAALQTDEVSA